MAITTLQGLADGILPGRPIGKFSVLGASGVPFGCMFAGSAGFPVGSISGLSTAPNGAVMTKNTIGALLFVNPLSGNTYLAGIKWPHSGAYVGLTVTLVDFLWSWKIDKTVITPQTVNSVAFPLRDINGTTNGDGVFIAVFVPSSNMIGSGDVNISYTNQDGVASKSGSMFWKVTNPGGTRLMPIYLDSGDTGVRSVQTLTLTSAYTGIGDFWLVAYRPIAIVASNNSGTGEPVDDAITFGMPRIYDDSCLTFLYQNGATILGEVRFAQG